MGGTQHTSSRQRADSHPFPSQLPAAQDSCARCVARVKRGRPLHRRGKPRSFLQRETEHLCQRDPNKFTFTSCKPWRARPTKTLPAAAALVTGSTAPSLGGIMRLPELTQATLVCQDIKIHTSKRHNSQRSISCRGHTQTHTHTHAHTHTHTYTHTYTRCFPGRVLLRVCTVCNGDKY